MARARASLVVPILAAAFILVLALFTSTPAASADTKSGAVAKGKYNATMFGCQDCHTPGFFYGAPDSTRQLSGSEVGWQGPWGVSYPANLTPDKETGLGTWTDQQIIDAFRKGVRPDGTLLRPPMPVPNFAHMTDADAQAIVAYLRSIPPVKHMEPAAVPPGGKATGAVMVVPPPPAWDAPRSPAKGAPPAGAMTR
jgi:mono/diheme cytochrome c family protein